MYQNLIRKAVEQALPAIGAAIMGGRISGGGGSSDGDWGSSEPISRSLPEYEGAVGDLDAIDPLAKDIDPSNLGSIPINQELKNAATTEATTTCQTCPVCGFMVDGKYVYAAYPVPWALDYQDRVVRLVAMGNLPFEMDPSATRIQEWQLPHAASGADPGSGTGFRSIDGFALLPCMLIEAKLGYGDYLLDTYNLRTNRTERTPMAKTSPKINTDNAAAIARMAGFVTQMRNHNNLAMRYPKTNVATQHTVVWCCSNMKTSLFCVAQIAVNGFARLRGFHVPIGMLPPSRWVTK